MSLTGEADHLSTMQISEVRRTPLYSSNGPASFEFTHYGLVRSRQSRKRVSSYISQSSICSDRTVALIPPEQDENANTSYVYNEEESTEKLTLEARFFKRHKLRRLSSGSIECEKKNFASCNKDDLIPDFLLRNGENNEHQSPLTSLHTILVAASEIERDQNKRKPRNISSDALNKITNPTYERTSCVSSISSKSSKSSSSSFESE